MNNKELQFALDKALEIAKEKAAIADHTSARMTISAIIGIAAGFILALILL